MKAFEGTRAWDIKIDRVSDQLSMAKHGPN